MTVKVGLPAPDAEVEAWERDKRNPTALSLSSYRGKWVVLFFYPRDFTFICPTEIAAFAAAAEQFADLDAVVLGASTDSFYSHKAWFESDPRLAEVRFPVIADSAQRLSRTFDVLLDDGATLRATFIMDPDGVLRHSCVNENDVGRNIDETLRVLQALRTGELCPVAWRPGEATLTTYDPYMARAFPRMSPKLLAEATLESETVTFAAGETIVEQGDPAEHMYVITRGEVDIVRHTPGREERAIATLHAGDHFGEIGLLTEARRTASVRARTDVELLELDWTSFRRLVEASDPVHADLAEIVRERLATVEPEQPLQPA